MWSALNPDNHTLQITITREEAILLAMCLSECPEYRKTLSKEVNDGLLFIRDMIAQFAITDAAEYKLSRCITHLPTTKEPNDGRTTAEAQD